MPDYKENTEIPESPYPESEMTKIPNTAIQF